MSYPQPDKSSYSYPKLHYTKFPEDSELNCQDVTTLEMEVIQNLMSISSTCGIGQHGLASAVMTNASYQAISAGDLAFVPPPDPGNQAPHAAGATAAQIAEANHSYDKQLAEFTK